MLFLVVGFGEILCLPADAQDQKQTLDNISAAFRQKNYAAVIKSGDSLRAAWSDPKPSRKRDYALVSFLTGSAYLETDQFDKAEIPLREAVDIFRKLEKRNNILGTAINNQGSLYLRLGRYTLAESLLKESLDLLRSINKGYEEIQFPVYMNLSSLYQKSGRFSQAETILEELKSYIPADNPVQQLAVESGLASVYTDQGAFEKAEAGITRIIALATRFFSRDSREYAFSILIASKYYYSLQDYDHAESLCEDGIRLLNRLPVSDKTDLPNALNNLAYIYYFTGRPDRADSLFSANLSWYSTQFGKNFPGYSGSLNGKALAQIDLKHPEMAIDLLKEGLAILEKQQHENSVLYSNLLTNLAIAYANSGQTGTSEELMLRALELTGRIFGKSHPEYQHACFNLATLYWDLNRNEQARFYFEAGMEIIQQQISEVFSYSTEEEKIQYRNRFALERNKYYSFCSQQGMQNLGGTLYNHILYAKGLLLNSLKQVTKDILSSPDSTTQRLYAEWMDTKSQLAFWSSKPVLERPVNVDSLKVSSAEKEKKLVRLSSALRQNRESAITDWKAVQQRLKPGEASIEFTAFQYIDRNRPTDSVMYVAFLLLPDDSLPEAIMLFEEKQLDSLMRVPASGSRDRVNQFYNSNPVKGSLYDLVWLPLAGKLREVKTIYYSPFGLLHKISFAAIRINETNRLIDRYHLVELNSTASLLDTTLYRIRSSDSLVLYGGIAYDADSTRLKLLAGNQTIETSNSFGKNQPDTREMSWNYLPFSKTEVTEIKKEGISRYYPVTVISDEYASEESLKSWNGKRSPVVLHIATHGYFFPDPKEKSNSKSQNIFRSSSNPLLRSGLFFAGAYYTWTRGRTFRGLEDGIATAYEIANMYLPNTRLCVLSACETGLGDLSGSEGVLGLQRAFRLAGVKNLLMSLWKVPDEETALFMRIFYNHLFREKPISEAFHEAQKALRQKYPDDPYRWAAFILVR